MHSNRLSDVDYACLDMSHGCTISIRMDKTHSRYPFPDTLQTVQKTRKVAEVRLWLLLLGDKR